MERWLLGACKTGRVCLRGSETLVDDRGGGATVGGGPFLLQYQPRSSAGPLPVCCIAPDLLGRVLLEAKNQQISEDPAEHDEVSPNRN